MIHAELPAGSRSRGHTALMGKRLSLPEPLHDYPPLYKLVWLHVRSAEGGELRVEELAHDLGIAFANATTALRAMIRWGAIIEIRARAGSIPGIYRVARDSELNRMVPYQKQQERKPRPVKGGIDA